MKVLAEYIERQEVMDFCRRYGEERKWMRSHDLPVDELPEEELFLRLIEEKGIVREAKLMRACDDLKEKVFEW